MIVRLNGGLGNQMFQYAFGRSVAKRRGEEVSFHKFNLDVGPRAYGLRAFSTQVEFALPINLKGPNSFGPEYYEPSFAFCPDVYTTRAQYFVGNWQTEKYFDEELVRNEFKIPLSRMRDQTWKIVGMIAEKPSCSIHVRRTDYLVPSTMAYHGSMGSQYYYDAIDYIIAERGRMRFFVFSDDPEWCRATFIGEEFVIVDHNKMGNGHDGPGNEHEDLFLMSACDHAIIPNSSFGWWGAWLGDREPDRIIIAPKNWFTPGGTAKHLDTKDICPESWVRM